MLKYFFEDTSYMEENVNQENLALFKGLDIYKSGDKYLKHAQKYPVVFLSFKNIKGVNFSSFLEKIKFVIASEFNRHLYLLNSERITFFYKKKIEKILSEKASMAEYENSLGILSEALFKHYKKPVIILIDEYDTPIQSAFNQGFFEKSSNFIKGFFNAGLKDNDNLFKGVVTGILRIAKESIFSDLNNLDVCTVLNKDYANKFGFRENEVRKALQDYNLAEKLDDIKTWYNGYNFGLDTVIYNPWSIINYLKNYQEGLTPYWVNSSDNQMIRDLLNIDALKSKEQIESLIRGDYIDKAIKEYIIFQDIKTNNDVVWGFLTHSGYLKPVSKYIKKTANNTETDYYKLCIPNKELKLVYQEIIMNWFKSNLLNETIIEMVNALLQGDIKVFELTFSKLALRVFSYHDTAKTSLEKELEKLENEDMQEKERIENFYHGFVLGLLIYISDDYYIESNKESGLGRCDISIIPKNIENKGIIMELKRAKKDEKVEETAERALKQIKEKRYDQGMINKGIKDILRIGIGFKGKQIKIISDICF